MTIDAKDYDAFRLWEWLDKNPNYSPPVFNWQRRNMLFHWYLSQGLNPETAWMKANQEMIE